jgi:glycerol-3-phosphate dehydrogenase
MLARAEAVRVLTAERFDVLVVGGGITGAGVALDAATRGYSVALVERADYASGPPRAPRSSSTAACATCRTSTSGSCARRCSSASSTSPWTTTTRATSTSSARPAAEDVRYLLDAVNAFFAASPTPADVAGAYAGARPLISIGHPRKSVDISRKAELYETSSGMVTITGGKLTTWRRMAKMTVDRIVEREGREAPCRTHQVPLGMIVDAAELPRVDGVGEAAYAQLAGRYGHAAREVLRVAAERPELAEPIQPGMPDLLAEAAYAARTEQARTVGDVLLRRTRLALTAREVCAPGAAAPPARRRRAGRRARLGRGPHRARGRRLRGRGGRRGRGHPLACATSARLGG